MDLLEDVLVENWSSFDAAESSNFMLELLGGHNPSFAMQSISWSEYDHAVDSHFWSQEHHPSINISTGTTMSGPSVLQEFDSNTHSMGFSNIGPIGSIGNPTRNGIAIGDTSTVKRKNEDCQGESHKKSKITATKVQKSSSTSTTVEANWQKFKCYSSDSESYASQELNAVVQASSACKDSRVVTLKGKTRSSRGSATDPQSLYARKRRERINERLRTLQNLVPNGTKVDISTMLEEAVQYVKFLQLQIKLLSSDELWMYAPFAYNGMNIGLDLKNFPTRQ